MKKIILALLLCSSSALAEDWNNPTLTSTYTSVISSLKNRDLSNAKLDYTSDTNVPVGAIKWNDTAKQFQKWSGSAWSDIWPTVTTHLASNSNPHSVTAAQVGAPTTATFNAHSGSTANPHSVTAAQVGALAKASNLSDVTNTTTARNNIGAAAAADLTTTHNLLAAHQTNYSNPHEVTTDQLGALSVFNSLSEIPYDWVARGNIGAAASGANGDITSLTQVSIVRGTNMTLQSDAVGSSIYIKPSQAINGYWEVNYLGQLLPPATRRPDYTYWTGWPGCTNCSRIRSLDPNAATARDCANAINTMYEDFINMGLYQ